MNTFSFFRLALGLAVVGVLQACANTAAKPFQNAQVLRVSGEHSGLCGGFSLSDAQAEQFLNRTRVITAEEVRDHYNFLPCYVEGRVSMFGEIGQECEFSIHAGGSAQLRCENGGRYLYVCDTCEHLLSGGEKDVAVSR